MFRTLVHVCVFLVGLLAVCWVGIGYLGSNPLGACVAAVIGACYVAGALELYRYRQATATLVAAVDGLATAPSALSDWLQTVHPGLRNAVRLRIKGERVALPAPVLTPYLVGLLVLLGMLGTLLGMMATLKGTGFALQSATDLQAIRGSLAAPVEGLAFAFGTSIAGVATSAMLGLLSALCRRERLQAVQRLDLKIAAELHTHSDAHRRGEAFKLQQQQSALMPALIDRLQTLMHSIEQHSLAAEQRLTAQQADFHAKSEAAYARLATAMEHALQAGVAESARAVGAALQPAMEATMASIARDTAALQAHVTQAVQQQLDGITHGFQTSASTTAQHWSTALAAQERAQQTHTAQLQTTLEQIAAHGVAVQDSVSSAVQQQLQGVTAAIEQNARTATEHWQVALAAQERTQATLTEQLQGKQLQGTLEQIDQRSVALQDSVTQAVQQQLSALDDGFASSTAATAATWAAVLAEQQRATETHSAQLHATLEQLAQQTSALHEGVQQAVQQQLDGLSSGFVASTATAAATWTAAVAEQQRANAALTQELQGTLAHFASTFETRSAALVDAVSQRMQQSSADVANAWSDALAQQQHASATLCSQHHSALAAATASFDTHAAALVGTLQQSHTDLQAALEARDTQRLALWSERFGAMSTALAAQWEQTGERVAQQQAICDTLASTASALSTQAQAQASATISEVSRLMQIASEAPKAAADVVAELRQSLSESMVLDTAMLEERSKLLATLDTLLNAVNHASSEQREAVDALVTTSADLLQRVGNQLTEQIGSETGKLGAVAAHVSGSAVEVASLGEAFGMAVQLFSGATGELNERLQHVATALDASLARSDDQLAYYVAQAREVVDLSMLSQKQIIEELRQLDRGRSEPGQAETA
ncbi:chemotaxis protein [Xanthomonas phaseoli pv. syngonii LMG 9055]|uniref:Chemotaxis protein n=1 Tax=Xanthomonas phaseoli pv. syngonii LMG 9055 TaxID=1437878 RepID=A0A1V9H451_9XANT|nr:chemotaxis protein [Xanthomonas phaseoli pv. syngonii LMG 9055]